MASVPQPAKKSYFFSKGYLDVLNTIKGAWNRNLYSLIVYKNNIANARLDGGKIFFIKLIINVLAMISVIVFGSIITAVVSAINIVVVLVMMSVIYIGFSLIWLADRIYLMRKKRGLKLRPLLMTMCLLEMKWLINMLWI